MPVEKICPIASLKQMGGVENNPSLPSCSREKCEWWITDEQSNAGRCALPKIAEMLRAIRSERFSG